MDKTLIIIVTYNGMKWIDKCLSSVFQSQHPVDCIVIDNASSDNTAQYISENYPTALLIQSNLNLGFGKANNIGIQYAIENNYDYVYLLNQDAWLNTDTISVLIDMSKQQPSYGILSPMQISAGGSLDYNFRFCCPKDIKSTNTDSIYSVDFVMAAHWLITKKCLRTVGGFSPSFPHYGEDHNYIHRAIFHGFKIGIVPHAEAVHDREYRAKKKDIIIRQNYLLSIVHISNPLRNMLIDIAIQPIRLFISSLRLRAWKSMIISPLQLLSNTACFIRNRKRSIQPNAFIKFTA